MYDGMSPVIRSMSNALHILIGSFEDMQSTASNPIDTSGIDSAVNNVKRIDGAIDSIEKNVGKVNINTTRTVTARSAIGTVNNAIDSIDRNVAKVNIDTSSIKAAKAELANIDIALDAIEDNVRKNTEEQNKFNDSISAGNDIASKFKSVLATIGVGMGIKEVLGLSDTLSQTDARLKMIADDSTKVNELQDKIFESAQRSRVAYTDLASTVASLSQRAGNLFNNDEAILFSENLNKMFTIAGASQDAMRSASVQLTQAMGSGVLRGEELNAIFENAPQLIQTIADYIQNNESVAKSMASSIGVSYESMSTDAMSHIRALAEKGQLSAELIKTAMLGATDDINRQFEEMPYTWGQVWTTIQNVLLNAFQPLLQVIGSAADWIGSNWSSIEPIFWGLAAAVGVLAAAYGIWKMVTLIQTAAQWALNSALLANPLTWIVIAIAAVVAAIVIWINKIGGLKVAWLTVVNAVLTAWDALKIGFFTGVFFVQNLFDKLSLALKTAGTNIANFMGDMKVNVLMILQNMINSAIDIINGFINALNKIPGVSINAIEKVTFATQAKIENEAAKTARNNELENYRKEIESNASERDAKLNQMKADARNDAAERQAKIDAAKKASADKNSNNGVENLLEGINTNTTDTASNTAAMSDSMGGLEDSLEYMVDVAEREVINRFTTAEISVTQTNNNNINSNMDIDGVMDRWNSDFTEILDTAAEGVHQ